MLFTSYPYLFIFLPAAVLLFFLAARYRPFLGIVVLTLASLIFYAFWDLRYLLLFLISVTLNYAFGCWLARLQVASLRPIVFVFALALNLAILGYFKYANFFVANIEAVTGHSLGLTTIILPLGISFFTFTQIAYICDVYSKKAQEYSFTNYVLFVSFFPHIIAGPILHHREMMPQFAEKRIFRPDYLYVSAGLSLIALGLFKKIVIADWLATYVNYVFELAEAPNSVSFFPAWTAALSYTFQIYFDFSGYSDIAVGSALLFGIRLPFNFESPYKATSIIDFWRRWHMTLSRFLRDYLYVPLGGNRRGPWRRYVNVLIVMVLGGMWHGAAWTFIAWGALHGLYLMINQAWRAAGVTAWLPAPLARTVGWLATFLAVVCAWVLFRADSFAAATTMLRGMAGLSGIVWEERHQWMLGPAAGLLQQLGVQIVAGNQMSVTNVAVLAACLGICLLLPNSQTWVLGDSRATWRWRPNLGWGVALGALAALAVATISAQEEFIYFNF